MKKLVLSIVFVMSVFLNYAQHDLNDYKYVIVEKQFHFQGEEGQYDLNEFVRFLFKKNGFKPILTSDIFPDDLKRNYCLALTSEIKAKGALRTKVTLILKNCNNEIVFQSEGITKEKAFDMAYKKGIRMAFEAFEGLNYVYKPKEEDRDHTGNSESEEANVVKDEDVVLKAFPTKNGYALKDSKGKTIHQVLKSRRDDMYFLSNNEGILYRKDGNKWVREFMKDNVVTTEILYIEF
jgi:hypothetical protein